MGSVETFVADRLETPEHMLNNNEIRKKEETAGVETPSESSSNGSNQSEESTSDLDEPEAKYGGNNEPLHGDEKWKISEKLISECLLKIKELEDRYSKSQELQNTLETKLETVTKQRDLAIKEKESSVMRYAVSERAVLEQKSAKESIEKKYKETLKENEIMAHKVSTMFSEKSRICQLLDNKTYEWKSSQQEVERLKNDLNSLETKMKWLQNNLKAEIEQRKENEAKVEVLTAKIQEYAEEIEQAKSNAETSIKSFHTSQENKAYVLEQQLKEQQASLILLRHERDDKDKHITTIQADFERLQEKYQGTVQENNTLSLKVQQLERERLENEQRLSELRCCADQQRQDSANLASITAQLDQLKMQIQNEHDQYLACLEQMSFLKQRNNELESDMESCREKEAELLLFTQQLTEKNVRLQSEFTAIETKVQQLTCEQNVLKRTSKEYETKMEMLSLELTEERMKHVDKLNELTEKLKDREKQCAILTQEVADQKGENLVIKRKLEHSLKEVNKELQFCRKKLDEHEPCSSSSSSTTLSNDLPPNTEENSVKVVKAEVTVNKKTLIEHIVKLQKASAKKSEKIDFLEEHVNTLIAELQRKTRLLQDYMIREQSGTLSSNKMDNNKAHIAKLHGVMASMYGSRVADDTLTLELSLDINRKLQAVLEDALLKNITLKENVDTLGAEIERLNNRLANQQINT